MASKVLVSDNAEITGYVTVDGTSTLTAADSTEVEVENPSGSPASMAVQNTASAALTGEASIFVGSGEPDQPNTVIFDGCTVIMNGSGFFCDIFMVGIGCSILFQSGANVTIEDDCDIELNGTTNQFTVTGGTFVGRGNCSMINTSAAGSPFPAIGSVLVTGTFNLGNSSGDSCAISIANQYSTSPLNAIEVHGTLSLKDSAQLIIADTFSHTDGSLVIANGASLTLAGSTIVTLDGVFTLASGAITVTDATIDIHNGSVFPRFSFVPTSLSVAFTDLSVPDGSGGAIASWLWDFGDSLTSPLQDPIHVYAMAGTYTVVLTTTDTDGNVSTCSIVVTV